MVEPASLSRGLNDSSSEYVPSSSRSSTPSFFVIGSVSASVSATTPTQMPMPSPQTPTPPFSASPAPTTTSFRGTSISPGYIASAEPSAPISSGPPPSPHSITTLTPWQLAFFERCRFRGE